MKQTGRQRATRIALDYHRQRDDLWRGRMAVAVVAFLSAVAYVAYGQFAPQGQVAYSHGPLAQPHARWEADCQACHRDFQPIQARAWWQGAAGLDTLSQNCRSCHATAGHHEQQVAAKEIEQACTTCHREHRGRAADLNLVADRACANCHRDLASTRTSDSVDGGAIEPVVTAFAPGQHPDFRSLSDDPGNVRFNHALHLLPGITAPDSRAGELTYAEIGEKYVRAEQQQWHRQYGFTDENKNDLVQLDCSACHKLDDPRDTRINWHMQAGRALMQPVNFETHCKACHVLDYTAGQSERIVPHGMTLARLREYLRLAAESAGAVSQQLDADIASAMQHLERKCGKCHEPAAIAGPDHQVVAPPRHWFQHAGFHHGAHTGVSCTTCHAQSTAVAQGGAVALLDGGTDQDRVMIKGIDVCFQCHEKSDQRASIARNDCVECHRYHVDPLDDPHYGKSTNRLLEPLLPKSD